MLLILQTVIDYMGNFNIKKSPWQLSSEFTLSSVYVGVHTHMLKQWFLTAFFIFFKEMVQTCLLTAIIIFPNRTFPLPVNFNL